MVRVCAFPGCGTKMKRYNPESFHRLPLQNSYMLKQWLVVLHVDVETPVETLRRMDYRVCSKHFDKDDFILSRRSSNTPRKQHLKKSAVPVADNLDEASGSSQLSSQENVSEIAALPQSTPKKFQHTEGAQLWRSYPPPALRLLLSTPEHATVRPRTTSRSSGMYHALPPTWQLSEDKGAATILHWTPVHASSGAMSQEDMKEGSRASVHDLCVSFGEMEDHADVSFHPLSDTTPSSQGSGSASASDQGTTNGWAGKKWIVDESNLLELFKTCHTCGTPIEKKRMVTRASQLKIYWTCLCGHSGEWTSCPDERDMGRNNLLICAATLFTGAKYTDIKDWADFINIQIPAKSQYYNIESRYLFPAINYTYKDQQQKLMERLTQLSASGERIDLCGDARCDSPGFSSKYSTYSFQDDASKEIVHYELVQVTEASSSVAMETMGFERGLDHLISKGVDVGVMTTDRSPSIRKIMKDKYTNIRHEFDSWHVNKSMKKLLVEVSNKAENRELQPWIQSISNHLYWSCSSSNGDEEDCVRRWTSLQYHICGVHRWEENGGLEYQCLHPPLTEEEQRRKKWLTKDSTAFRALRGIIMDKNLLRDIRQMSLFKHTGSLEVYHNVTLKYAPKRLHFGYDSMRARTELAIMDHNMNVGREQKKTQKGDPQFKYTFTKASHQCVAKTIYEKTSQGFRKDLMEVVLRMNGQVSQGPILHHAEGVCE